MALTVPADHSKAGSSFVGSLRQAQRFTAWPCRLLSLSAAQARRHLQPASLQAVARRNDFSTHRQPVETSRPDPEHEVKAELAAIRHSYVGAAAPKIHQSVMDRIRSGNDGYAPIVLPEIMTSWAMTARSPRTARIAASRALARIRQEKVWDWVWARRVTYFLTVFASLFLAALPLIEKWRPGRGPASPAEVVVPDHRSGRGVSAGFRKALA